MIAVVQRVTEASVSIESVPQPRCIGHGLCVLIGVEQGDGPPDADWMAGKLARLRIFRDDEGKMNRSVEDVGGSLLVVSQFTLAGDCRKGNRPSFVAAADPETGEALYRTLVGRLEERGLPVETGEFGAMMRVRIENDGPVTLIVRSPAAAGAQSGPGNAR